MHHSKQTLFYYFLLSLVLGSGLHFLYTLIPSPVITLIAPISESLWEHTKIIYWPYLLLALICNRKELSAIGSWLLALPIMCCCMLIIGYVYHVVFGLHALWFDLLLFCLIMAFGFWFPSQYSVPFQSPLWYFVILLVLLFALFMIVFTFSPPEFILFQNLSHPNS